MNLTITSVTYIPVQSCNNFTLTLIFFIPIEPLRIISDSREISHTKCHISMNRPTHTSCQSRRSYTVLLTQAVK
ncbi:Pyridoxal-phosphate-dependent serine hydroxymethyltransferase [Gossypium arboreum]|uniref:Pyridoxal-phosphate-dependent serine hydroxymethyltransferase n=1 Tax=Gossypium arboreum TaxID=29729 RepID=A0A0B0MSJ4_GOSAR|nr:Pyridoxal-phosphate-dependent serine hydroxymethyltransferase [Gossypium arboreum]